MTTDTTPRVPVAALGAFFALMYFVQSVADPASGITAQPVRSLLKSWDLSAGDIALFMALVALPWACKPVFGLLSDFVPLFGSRRRNYLVLATLAAGFGCAVLAGVPLGAGDRWLLLGLLLLPAVGVAFGDVLIDGLMVTEGQPRGLTGVFQSVQWTASYGGLLLAGLIGGWFSEYGRADLAFAFCALLWGASLALAVLVVREERVHAMHLQQMPALIRSVLSTPGLLALCGFLFVWSFNPLWTSVLYLHLTESLGLSEISYGTALSVFSVGAMCASAAYPLYCRRVRLGRLLHVSIVTGVVSNAVYVAISGEWSAYVTVFVSGFAYMSGTMIQLDVAARRAPIAAAATVFALLMALTNLSASVSEALGGGIYERLQGVTSSAIAYQWIVALSAILPAFCWLIVPRLHRELPEWFAPLPRRSQSQ